MEAVVTGVLMLIGMAAVFLLGLALGAGSWALLDGHRKRRDEAVERQIALTDALDARLGPIVSPVVTKPRRGPWEISMAVPFLQPAAVATVLAVVDEVFTALDPENCRSYRVVLRARDPEQGQGPTSHWTANRLAAA
ncbi:MAG: hypothetical protein ACE147_14655 [Candidatus Methylomirabilales bacterium]